MSPWRKLLFSALVVLCAATLAEALARALGPGLMPPDTSRDAAPGEPVPGEPNLVGDAVAGWRIVPGTNRLFGVPGTTRVDARGIRGSGIDEAPAPGERRVLLLGDSTVYGVMVRDEDTFGQRAEVALRAVDPGVRVLNAGCPGYSSWQARRALALRLLDTAPDLVVVATLWSDTQGADRPDSVRFGEAAVPRLGRVLARSHAYLLLREALSAWRWGAPRPPVAPGAPEPVAHGLSLPVAPTWRVPLDEYAANLDEMARLAHEAGAAVAFLVLPCVRDPLTGRVGDYRDAWREAMRAAARRHGALLVDTPPAFEGRDAGALFLDEVHPSAAGHALIGEVLAQALEPWARGR